jgi:hypothetical protein
MRSEKELLERSADRLMKKADDCFGLADAQHDIAEKQHELAARQHHNADQLDTGAKKLEALGSSLEVEAVQIKGVTEAASARSSPGFRESGERLPPAVRPAAPPANSKP